jgi:hypothetical protein
MIGMKTHLTLGLAAGLLIQTASAGATTALESVAQGGSFSLPPISAAIDSEAIYEKLYAEGRLPEAAEIQGDWRGTALVFARRKPLPDLPIFNLLVEAVSLKLWEGKTFLENGGANRFLGGRLKLIRFSTEVRPSRTGQGQALALDYGRNPFPISAVKDEVRIVADGRLLGRAYMQIGSGKEHFLFFFMLAKTEAPVNP